MPNTNRKSNEEPVKIGTLLQGFMQDVVEKKSVQYEAINRLWEKIVPGNLQGHCHIIEIEEGVIKAQTDSPSIAFELRMESKRMLSEIQKMYPAMRIKRLKFVASQAGKDFC